MAAEIIFASGAVTESVPVFEFNSFFAFDLVCHHDSSIGLTSGFGRRRWSLLDAEIKLADDHLDYIDEYGRRIEFDHPSPNVGEVSRNARYPALHLSAGRRGALILRDGKFTHSFHRWSREAWRLAKIEDKNGNVFQLTRDAAGLVTRVDHPCGLSVTFDNDGRGLRTRATLIGTGDATRIIADFRYDARGNLVELDMRNGRSRYYGYDDRDCLTTWSDGGPGEVRYGYDEKRRVVSITVDDRAPDLCRYDEAARRATLLPGGREELAAVMEYDADRQLVRKSYPAGTAFENVFDEDGRLISKRDAFGYETRAAYDGNGNLCSLIDAEGRQTASVFDDYGNMLAASDGEGNTWRYDYDEHGNLVSMRDPLGNRTDFTNDAAGLPTGVMRHDGLLERRDYDARHRLVRLVDYRGGGTAFERDAFGRVVAITDPLGVKTRFGYDDERGLTFWYASSVVRPDGATLTRYLDRARRAVSMTDGEGRRTVYSYGVLGLPSEAHDPGGGRTRYAYDHEGRLIRAENQLGRAWTFARDAAGDVVEETDFDGLTIRYRRDRAGREAERLLADGARIASFHDRSGLLVRQEAWQPDAVAPEVTHYRYDGRGLLAGAENDASRVAFERDGMGRITAETANGRRVESSYDCCGNRIERRIDEHLVASAYDPLGALSVIAIGGHAPLAFERDAGGREVGRASEAGFRMEQGWDALGQLAWQRGGRHGGSAALGAGPASGFEPGIERSYRWDKSFAPVAIADARWGETRYDYDANGQVTQARHGDGGTERFSYDGALNIAASAGGASPLVPRRLGPGGRVLEGRGPLGERVALAYDERNRVVERRVERDGFRPRTWRYGWDARDRLVRCDTPEGERWAYGYDPFGRRVTKARQLSERETAWVRARHPGLVPAAYGRSGLDVWPERPPGADASDGPPVVGLSFLWDGDVVAEEAPLRLGGAVEWGEATRWHFEPGGFVPLVKEAGGRLLHVVTDHLGTPRELVDEAGGVVWAGEQHLWGGLRRACIVSKDVSGPEPTSIGRQTRSWAHLHQEEVEAKEEINPCPISFQGQWQDAESSVSYNRHRHYDALSAQYISPDPIGIEGGESRHGYSKNSVVFIDPLGLQVVPHGNNGVLFGPCDLYPDPDKNTVTIQYTGDRTTDSAAANRQAGFPGTTPPRGYTWHHVGDYNSQTGSGTMQLVDRTVHGGVGHDGGVAQHNQDTGTKYDTPASRQAAKQKKSKCASKFVNAPRTRH